MTLDAGLPLLGEVHELADILGRLARCFSDFRESTRIGHSVGTLAGQRIPGLALGYEDRHGHDRLRDDKVLALPATTIETVAG